jgi:hypothetical protein
MSILGNLISPVSELLKEILPDTDKRAALAHEIATMASRFSHEEVKAQLEVNKAEAEHQSLFVSGWRPAVGWTCCMGMAGNFILFPLTNFVLALAGEDVVIPMIDMTLMMPVLMGMLGLGAMRTVEKINKVERKH